MAQRKTQKADNRRAKAKLEALRRAEARKRRRTIVSVSAIAAVFVVVLGMVGIKLATTTQASEGSSGSSATSGSPQVIDKVTSVPASVFDTIGTGGVRSAPAPIPGGESLTKGGKPRVLYVGAEYCPYCAAERWAVVSALSRFGSFHGLGQTASSSSDIYPSTPTLSFHGSGYTSKYLTFDGFELQSNKRQGSSYAPLDTLSGPDQAVFAKFDAPPYVPSQSAGAIPFIDLGGAYLVSGASYDPGTLKGLTRQQVASALSDPSSAVARNIDGTANLVTAALCRTTNNQPANVCRSTGVTTAARSLSGS